MSAENVEAIRRAYEEFAATGELSGNVSADFVWDMSTFRNWPERQTYEGADGAREFLTDWTGAWEDWKLEVRRCALRRRRGLERFAVNDRRFG